MMLLVAIWGGMMGLLSRYLYQNFMFQLKRDIYQSYHWLLHKNLECVDPNIWFKQQMELNKCGGVWLYFLGFACLFMFIFCIITSKLLAIIYCLFITIVFTISLIDWKYQLIPPYLCQSLLWLGIITAWLELSPLVLDQVLPSIIVGFSCCYILYYGTQWLWGKESLGRGDYWLVAGLASFLEWQELPLFFFLASSSALCYITYNKFNGICSKLIPFAPFLCLAATGLLGIKLL